MQRVELSSRENSPMIEDGCTDLTLAVTDEAVHANLVLPSSLTRVQITGKESLDGLTLSGVGQVVRLVASDPRSIRELRVDCLVLEVANLTVSRLHLLDSARDLSPPGVCFVHPPRPMSILCVSSQERVVVRQQNSGTALGVFVDRDSNASSGTATSEIDGNPGAEVVHLKIKELRVPSLVLATGVCMALEDWSPGVTEGLAVAMLAGQARLRLVGKASVGPMLLDAPEASLEMISAIAERVSGVLGCLTTSGPCVLRGDGLHLSRLRCDAGADVSGLVVHSLDLASLSHAAQASAFDVMLPKDRSWHGFHASTTPTWWQEAASWRALYQQLERKGRPATAAWARRMEREARRTSASRSSVEYAVLETAHLLGYGESVLRPLLAQAFVALLAWALIIVAKAHPVTYDARDFVLLIPRLYLAPLSLLKSSKAFAPEVGPSIFDTVAWTGAVLSGAVCFGTAALAVRRMLAYS